MDKQEAAREAFETGLPEHFKLRDEKGEYAGQYSDTTIEGQFRQFCKGYEASRSALMPALVEARDALEIAQEAAECFPDVHDGRVEPLQILEHLHEWEAKYITFGNVAGADKALARLNAIIGDKK